MSDELPEALAAALARQRDALAALDLPGVDRAAIDAQAFLPAVGSAEHSAEARRRLADLAAVNRALAAQALELADAFLKAPAGPTTYARSGRLRRGAVGPRFEAVG